MTAALNYRALATAFPDTGLGRQLRLIALLIASRGNRQVPRQGFFCSTGGFDTHGDDQSQRQNEFRTW